jgi:hypothetical protein
MLVWQWWHSAGGVFPIQSLVEEIEVPEPPADGKVGFLEGLEVGLCGDPVNIADPWAGDC